MDSKRMVMNSTLFGLLLSPGCAGLALYLCLVLLQARRRCCEGMRCNGVFHPFRSIDAGFVNRCFCDFSMRGSMSLLKLSAGRMCVSV